MRGHHDRLVERAERYRLAPQRRRNGLAALHPATTRGPARPQRRGRLVSARFSSIHARIFSTSHGGSGTVRRERLDFGALVSQIPARRVFVRRTFAVHRTAPVPVLAVGPVLGEASWLRAMPQLPRWVLS